MIQRLPQILKFFGLGAIVTTIVAWGFAVAIDPFAQEGQQDRSSQDDQVWVVSRWSCFGTTMIASYRSRSGSATFPKTAGRRPVLAHNSGSGRKGKPEALVDGWSGFDKPTEAFGSGTRTVEMRYADGRGWPMRALWSETVLLRAGYPVTTGKEPFEPRTTSFAIETRLPPWTGAAGTPVASRLLPLRPIPIGFVLNSLLYGGILRLAAALIPRRQGRSEEEQAVIDAAVERFQVKDEPEQETDSESEAA